MKNQIEIILGEMQKHYPKREYFSLKEIHSFIHKWIYTNPRLKALDTADYPHWQKNYLADLLKNYSTKPKKPKIKRKQIQGKWHYALNQ